MATHVAEGAGAVIGEAAPEGRYEFRTVGARRRHPEPEIPVQRRWHGRLFGIRVGIEISRVKPGCARSIRPRVHGVNLADQPGLHPLAGEADALGGAALVAHLGHDARGFRGGMEAPHLGEATAHRLLDVDVLLRGDRGHRDREVHVVRRRDRDGVDLVRHLLKHQAEVLEPLGVFQLIRRPRLLAAGDSGATAFFIHVAQGDELLAGETSERSATTAAHADLGDAQTLVGRARALAAQAVRQNQDGAERRRRRQKLATRRRRGRRRLRWGRRG